MMTDSDRPSDTEEEDHHSSGDSESDDDDAGGLLDLEAEESDGASDGSTISSDHGGSWQGPESLPQFMRFPAEIRHHIWHFFAPDLKATARILEFHVAGVGSSSALWEGPSLSQQLAPVNTLLATHRETRSLALRKFPDTLDFRLEDGSLVRYNKESDVIFIASHENDTGALLFPHNKSGFFANIRNLAVHSPAGVSVADSASFVGEMTDLMMTVPNLKTLYQCFDYDDLSYKHLRWCVADSVNRYDIEQEEATPYGVMETIPVAFTWPELTRNHELADQHIPVDKLLDSRLQHYRRRNRTEENEMEQLDENGDAHEDDAEMSSLEIWPMVRFFGQDGVDSLCNLLDWGPLSGTGEVPSGSESESETDEYESDGIDDQDIVDLVSDEDEDDLAVLPLSGSEDTEGRSVGDGHGAGFDNLGEHAEANFSSAEGSAARARGASGSEEEEEADSDDTPLQRPKQPRRRVVESDSEGDESGAEEPSARRPTKRRARVMLSSSDAEEGNSNQDDAVSASDHGYESDEEEEESDDKPIQPLSLAERLRLHREENPVSSPSQSGSDPGDGGGGGDYDGWDDGDRSENDDDDGQDGEGAHFGYGEEEDLDEYE